MKKSIILLLLITLSTFSLAKERISLNSKIQKEVSKVLEINENLHQSFFSYKGEAVEKLSTEMGQAIEKITDPKIKKLLSFSRLKLNLIKAKSKRKENDQNYHLVSMALIHIVNTYDVGEKYNAYSCPMVKKKWVQNSKKLNKVHNPYAPKMAHCGSKDTDY
jgi:hypothetical protein